MLIAILASFFLVVGFMTCMSKASAQCETVARTALAEIGIRVPE